MEEKQKSTASRVDLSAGKDDDFSHIVVSEVIKAKMEE